MPLLGIEPKPLGITPCSLVTILIMLTQLPLLASSRFVFLVHTIEKALHGTAFISTILIPRLQLLISNLCASER